MKTLVRITADRKLNSTYQHFYIQLLRYRWADSEHVECFATISFQSGGESGDDWYGFNMECTSDNDKDFTECARILKFIRANRDRCDIQPKELLALIGAQEFVMFEHEMIPASYNGMKRYNVLNEDGTQYTRIIAPSETLAMRKLKARKLESKTLVFDKIVSF